MLAALITGFMALSAAPRASAAGCEADHCTISGMIVVTEPDGRATLKIPGKLVRIAYPALKECTWEVEAQYGDGSPPGSYVFSEAAGLEAEHTYPEPGTYTFNAYATNGMHDGTSEPCPDVHIEATVIYSDSTPEEPEGHEPEGVKPPPSGGAGSPAVTLPPLIIPPLRSPKPVPFWKACGGGVRAHLVGCDKAKRVIHSARELLSRSRPEQGATFRAAGFSCRVRNGGTLSCRHGAQRVLGT
jgi:hypothetical protein